MAEEKLVQIKQILPDILPNEDDRQVFLKYYQQYLTVPSIIDWSQLKLFDKEKYQIEYESLPTLTHAQTQSILSRVAVIKLNGGLGTTMGCSGPKSLITIRDGRTFLEFAIEQNERLNEHHGSQVPLLLMDSFRTRDETAQWLKSHGCEGKVEQFTQSQCPRIYADSLMPVPSGPDDRLKDGWYPPGHGNVFAALQHNGLLDRLLESGRDVIFVSNIDNTAATVDVQIASVICREDVEYVMENTNKTGQDVKGGTLIEYEGAIKHLELPHVPPEHVDEFWSLRTFNTNNIWVDLKAVKRMLSTIRQEVLPNKKLESAIGGAIRNFELAKVVHVPRRRFRPVKKTQDLMVIMSDAFEVDRDGVLVLSTKRTLPNAPVVHLSKEYDHTEEYFKRVPHTPSLLELVSLKVLGDVTFGAGVQLKGEVTIEALNGPATIPDGSLLEGHVQL